MIVGALVLPETRLGMIEASTTRKPGDAAHAQPLVNHRHLVLSHLAGADRVIDGAGGVASDLKQFVRQSALPRPA